MLLVSFSGRSDEDDDSFSTVGWTNYPDDGSLDDADELASDLIVSIEVVTEIPFALGGVVSQSPSQEEDIHNETCCG